MKAAHGPGHVIGECLEAGVEAPAAYRAAMMSFLLVGGSRSAASDIAFWLKSSMRGAKSVQEMNSALKASAVKIVVAKNLALGNADEMLADLDKLVVTVSSGEQVKGQVSAGLKGALENLRQLIKTSSDNGPGRCGRPGARRQRG